MFKTHDSTFRQHGSKPVDSSLDSEEANAGPESMRTRRNHGNLAACLQRTDQVQGWCTRKCNDEGIWIGRSAKNVDDELLQFAARQIVGRREQSEPSERHDVEARLLEEDTELVVDFLRVTSGDRQPLPAGRADRSTIALLIVVAGRPVACCIESMRLWL